MVSNTQFVVEISDTHKTFIIFSPNPGIEENLMPNICIESEVDMN